MTRIIILVCVFSSVFFDALAWKKEERVDFTVHCFLDSLNTLSSEQLLTQHLSDFTLVKKPHDINFGHRDVTAWLMVKLNVPKKGSNYIMTLENAHLDSISFYRFFNKGQVDVLHTGDHLPFDSREYDYNMFAFTLSDTCDFFLVKVKSEGTMIIPLTLNSLPAHIHQSNASVFLFSLFFGVLLLALVINILLYFRVSENIYFYYALCLIASGVINATDLGLLYQVFWPNAPVMNHYSVVFYGFTVFNLLFGQQILSLKQNSRVLNGLFSWCIYIMLFAVVLNLLGFYRIVLEYLSYYFYFISLMFLFSGFYIYFIKKYRPAFYYMLAWSTFAVFAIIYMLASDGVIVYNFYTQSALIIGTMLEITLLFLAVIDKIYEFRKAKDEATIKSLQLVEENRQLLFEQNLRLEHMVKLRTKELELLNYEVQAQNEELNASQDQLGSQNEIIQNQNRLLAKKKKKLQKIVKKRTLALEVSNAKLVHKNNTLERFGYFTAHNLRGPVSSIMGLVNLFKLVKDNSDEHDHVVALLKQSSSKLDEVVRDMITLLDFNNAELIECQLVSVASIYQESKEQFVSKLSDEDVVFFIEKFTDSLCLADQVIVKFIFDQLIDNAFKFREPNRKLEISIREEEEEEQVCYYISDNGIGFDSEKFDKDLFGLYKRFHTSNFSGKGLGLYFIKEYMGRMNGKVSLTGVKGVGTTVKLSFAKGKEK